MNDLGFGAQGTPRVAPEHREVAFRPSYQVSISEPELAPRVYDLLENGAIGRCARSESARKRTNSASTRASSVRCS